MFAANPVQPLVRLGWIVLLGSLLTGCLMSGEEAGSFSHPARVTVEFNLRAEGTQQASASSLMPGAKGRRMLVLMVSGTDTLCDTLTRRGATLSNLEGTFLPDPSSADQTIAGRYNLAPGKKWKILARLIDARDSVRSGDSLTVSGLKEFENRSVQIILSPRFASYSAKFSLPPDVRFVGAPSARQIYFTRLTFVVDGRNVRDSMAPAQPGASNRSAFMKADPGMLTGAERRFFFKPSTLSSAVSLTQDYVQAGGRQVLMQAFGYLEGDTVGVTPLRLLYQGSHNFRAVLGKTLGEEPVSLEWKAAAAGVPDPAFDQTGLLVRLGRVGTVVIKVVTSGALNF